MRLGLQLSIGFTATAAVAALACGALGYVQLERLARPLELKRLQDSTSRRAERLSASSQQVRWDVQAIARQPGVRRWVASGGHDAAAERSVVEGFVAELEAHAEYLQLRLLGADGVERLRVERTRSGDQVREVPAAELQDKRARSYVQRGLALEPGAIHVSSLSLNQERGTIQLPPVPVVRVVTPLDTASGSRFGVLVLNLDMSVVLSPLRASPPHERVYLVDEHGRFLLHPDSALNFGFEFGRPRLWSDEVPSLAHLAGQEDPTVEVDAGRETCVAAVPLRVAGGPRMTVLTSLPYAQVLSAAHATQRASVAVAVLLLPLVLGATLLLVRWVARPLEQMAESVSAFRIEDPLELERSGVSEIDQLQERFETMAVELRTRAALETEFKQRQQHAQKLAAIGELAGGVAHDFNNMLAVIVGAGELAKARLPAEHPVQELLASIVKAGDRSGDLTRQLLAFSRRQHLEPRVLELRALIQGVLSMMQRVLPERIEVRFRGGEGSGRVRVDPNATEQALVNLIVNARDAMPEGGILTVETENVDLDEGYTRTHPEVEPGPYVQVSISDTGAGISEADQERVFEPFFTTKPLGQGTGLGLASVHGFVKQSQGSIWVYSEVGIGTTFKIYLPRLDDAASEPDSTPTVLTPASGQETVLVVEDSPLVQRVTRMALEEYGFEVICADSGEAALAEWSARGEEIDVLLTDLNMPGLGGRELVQRLRADGVQVPVVYMSGYTEEAAVQGGEALDPGVAFVQKPFTPLSLIGELRKLLDRDADTLQGRGRPS